MKVRHRLIVVGSAIAVPALSVLSYYSISQWNSTAGGVNVFDAVESGDLLALDNYAHARGDLNCRSWDRMTPLYIALVTGKRDTYKKLLELGADPNVIMRGGRVITHYAAEKKDSYWLKLAVEHRADANLMNDGAPLRSRGTPLMWAISSGAFENITLLVDHGADVNTVIESTGMPVLVYAMYCGRFDAVLYMLERGANYNVARMPVGASQGSAETFIDVVKSRNPDWFNNFPEQRQQLEAVRAWLRERGVTFDDEQREVGNRDDPSAP